MTHRNNALGESFDAQAASHITLYGFAKHMFEYFGHEPKIKFLPWPEWCEYEGSPEECEHTYYHIARSGVFSIEKAQRLKAISSAGAFHDISYCESCINSCVHNVIV